MRGLSRQEQAFFDERKIQQREAQGKQGARTVDLFVKEDCAPAVAEKLRRFVDTYYNKERKKFLFGGTNVAGEPRGLGKVVTLAIVYLCLVRNHFINAEGTVMPYREFLVRVFDGNEDFKVPARNKINEMIIEYRKVETQANMPVPAKRSRWIVTSVKEEEIKDFLDICRKFIEC